MGFSSRFKRLVVTLLLFFYGVSLHQLPSGFAITKTPAKDITTTGFSGKLVGKTDVQAALNVVDSFVFMTNPMTTLGDMVSGGVSGAAARVVGNVTTTRKFLRQTGTGSASAAPVWDTVTKTDVGLSAVDNTSDAGKPVSTAQQAALDLKENLANKSTNTSLGASDTLYPSQNAVKTYADTKVTANSPITGATKTKITYAANGLVTAGANATTDDIAEGATNLYFTAARAITALASTLTGYVQSVTATSPLFSSGGQNPNLTIDFTKTQNLDFFDGSADCLRWTFHLPTDIRTDNPYFYACKDRGVNGNGFSWFELRPGAHDLRVMDDVMMLDTTPNLRWYDIVPNSQDYEAQVANNDWVLKRSGDITAGSNLNYTPGIYETQEMIHIYGSSDHHVTGDILQLGGNANFISMGETANPSTYYQITHNVSNVSTIAHITSTNTRSSGAVADGFGNGHYGDLEDDSGSTGIHAVDDTYDWVSSVHGAASAERTWYSRQNNALVQDFSVDGTGNGIWGTHSTATARFHIMMSGSYDTSIAPLLNLEARTTGTAGAGHGTSLVLSGQDSDGNHNVSFAKVEGIYHDGGTGAQTAEYRVEVRNNGSMTLQEVIDESLKHGWGDVTNPSSRFDFVNSTSGTSDVADTVSVERKSSGTAADGIGIRNIVKVQNAAGNQVNAYAQTTKLSDATNGYASYQEFTQQVGGLTGTKFINQNGWSVIGSGTSPNGFFDIHKPNATGLTAESPSFYVSATTQELANLTTLANFRNILLQAPTYNVASGGTATITAPSHVFIDGDPVAGTGVTFSGTPYALNVNSGHARFNATVNLPALTASTLLALDSSKNVISAAYPTATITAVGDITSGDAGTSAAALSYLYFKNATSGTVKLQTVTGALGTPTLSLPAETGTLCSTGSVCSGYQASGTYTNTVTNADGSLTISPTSGSVVASLNVGHANTWTGAQKVLEFDYTSNSPAQITADQNDYAPSANTFLRLNSDATRNITGFGSPVSGKKLEITNVGSFNIVLKNQNTGSSSSNRIRTSTGSDITILPDQTVDLIYDGTTVRWRDTALQAGILPAVNFPALTGDLTTAAGALATTLATVNGNVGSFGSSTAIPVITANAKGLVTALSTAAVIAPAGTLTGTTLASNVVTSSLTALGTVATGVWNATVIAMAYGGLGSALSDPNANSILGWDDTDNTNGFWNIGSGLTYTHSTHTLSASGGSGTITAVGDVTSGDAGTAAAPISYTYFKNATSGSIKVQTVAGALGTPTISWPAETGTVCTTGSVCSGYQASGTYANTVSNSDGTLTISPTSGTVVASLALGHANTWTGAQKFNELDYAANSPAQITADQNDYAPSANSVLRLSSDATRTITGFGSPTSGRHVKIINVGSFNIILSNQNTGSSSANRIRTATGSDITLLPDQSVQLIYDGTTTRWRDVSAQSGIIPAVNFPALTGNVTTTAGSLATTIAAGVVTNAMLAGSIAASKLVGSDIATVGTITAGVWNGTAINLASYATGILPSTSFPALTGDITTTSGSVATTIGANKVTLANLATLAANSAIANSTGSTATPTAVSMLNTATASSIALRDGNANLLANNFLQSYTTTATAAGTTTLTVGSTHTQFFTGSTTQTVVLPVASTLALNQQFKIVNNSTGAVTVQSSGGNTIVILGGSTTGVFTCILTSGTGTGSWNYSYLAEIVASGKTLNVSNSLTLAGTDGTTMTFPSTSATVARTDAANTFTGHQTIEGVTSTGATGTGKFVFDNSPTLVTPTIGAAVGTSLTLSSPGTSSTDVPNLSNTVTLTNKRITKRDTTTTQSATPTINTDNTDHAHITGLAQAITSFTTNLSGTPVAGDTLWIDITDNGTARAITWGTSFEASTVALPTTTVVNARLDVGFVWNEVTSKWRCIAVA